MDQGLRPHQIGGLVFNTVLGVGVLTVARSATEAAGTGAWLAMLLAGLLASGAAWLAGRVANLWPGLGLVEGVATLWGPWAGRALGMVYGVYLLLLTSLVIRLFGEFAGVFLLPRTPLAVTVAALAAVVAYAGRLRVTAFAGVSDLLVWLGLFSALVLLLMAQQGAEPRNLMPVLSTGWRGLLTGAGQGLFAFLGFEVVLFLGAYAAHPQSLGRWAAAGVAVAGLLYAGAVLVSLGHFSPAFIAHQTWPLFNVAGTVQLRLQIIEQPEVLVAALWAYAAFSTAAVTYLVAQLALAGALGLQRRPPLALLLIVPVYGVSLVPRNLQNAEEWADRLTWPGLLLAVGVPLLLMATAWFRGRHDEKGRRLR